MATVGVTREGISAAANEAGLRGRCVCVHSSLRSFGRVDGGPETVISALLDLGCTVMVPTFSWSLQVPPPASDRPDQNGTRYDVPPGRTTGIGRLYDTGSNEIDADMGAVPAAALRMPGRARGNHPLCSFTAVGPRAEELISGQAPMDVFAPLRALARAEGLVVLMGVGLTRMTALHLAETMAGRRPFIRWANGPGLRPVRAEAGGCSDGFEKLAPVLSPLEIQVRVGGSLWRVFPLQEALTLAASAIRNDSMIVHCGSPDCDRCNDAVRGGPTLRQTRY